MELQVKASFDDKTYRHYLNGTLTVLHCHHYMSLTTQLAKEHEHLGGTQILEESIEDAVRPMFDDYIRDNAVSSTADRLAVAEQYFSVMGLGKVKIVGTEKGGTATLERSHVDQGWVNKIGKSTEPIGYFNRGYLVAAFCAAFNKPPHAYQAVEESSIAMGAETGTIQLTLR